MEPTVVEITGTKKTVVLSVVGTVLALCLLAAVVPTAREYVVTMVKLLLDFTKAISF